MANRTSYLVDVEMRLQDKASRGLGDIGSHAHRAESDVLGLKEALVGIGAAFTIERGIEKGKELFVGFNKELQTLRISSAAMLQANGLAKTFDQAQVSASGFVDEYLRFGQVAGILTKDIFEVSNGIAVSVAQAGGGIKDITEVAERGAVAAKAYGVGLQYASLEISEAITRGAQVRQVFAKQLIATQHMSIEEFNKLSEGDRLKVIERALNSPAMQEAAKAFGQSFEGVVTRLEDMIQILGGKAGLPLFQAITSEIEGWNDWLKKNEATVEKFGHEVGHDLVTGFHALRDGAAFLFEHRSALISIAEAYAALKFGGIAGDLASGIAGVVGGGGGIGEAIGKQFTSVVAGAGLGIVIGKELTDFLDRPGGLLDPSGKLAHFLHTDQAVAADRARTDRTIDLARRAADAEERARAFGVSDPSQFAAAQERLRSFLAPTLEPLVKDVRAANAFTEGRNGFGVFDPAAFRAFGAHNGMSPGDIESEIVDIQRAVNAANMAQLANAIFGSSSPAFDSKNRTKAQLNVNQHISVVNHVASNDPDRFAMDFSDALKRVATNPRQARSALRGM